MISWRRMLFGWHRAVAASFLAIMLNPSSANAQSFLDVLQQFQQNAVPSSQQRNQQPAPDGADQPSAVTTSGLQVDRRQLSYHGYSARYKSVRQPLYQGAFQDALNTYHKKNISRDKLLRAMELGALSMDAGHFDGTVEQVRFAIEVLNDRVDRRNDGGKTILQTVGIGEGGHYTGAGYERIMLLNYMSMALLLQGDRAAYNTAKLANQWQIRERDRFEKLLAEKQAELEKEIGSKSDTEQKTFEEMQQQFAGDDKIAGRVASAYVNPLADYLSGVVLELESYSRAGSINGARVAYERAYKLNPAAAFLNQAARDMKKRNIPANRRLVHFVIAEGVAPERKMLQYYVGEFPIRLPAMDPLPSDISYFEVQGVDGSKLARLTPLADLEAMIMRQQKDLSNIHTMQAFTSIARKIARDSLLADKGIIGGVANLLMTELDAPDMRSWGSLARIFHATRLHIPKDIKELQIVAFTARGKKLMHTNIDLGDAPHNFVYGRALGSTITANANRKLWLNL